LIVLFAPGDDAVNVRDIGLGDWRGACRHLYRAAYFVHPIQPGIEFCWASSSFVQRFS
jgi:hypothetical protein